MLVYRAARIVNFAQAEIGGLAAGGRDHRRRRPRAPVLRRARPGLAAALATGFLIDATVVRRFFTAPRLILMVATLGVAQVLGALQIALPTWFTDLDLFESVQVAAHRRRCRSGRSSSRATTSSPSSPCPLVLLALARSS